MMLIEFVQNIVVTILIGYLGLTNSLASFLESVFSPASENTEEVASAPDTETFTSIAKNLSATVPRILLEDARFQRAAVLASKEKEDNTTEATTTPTEDILERSLVNVYCQYKTDTHIRTTTGTGFFINPKGVILTNAHVAQFLLLEETDDVVSDVDCVIRTGNPAEAKYRAELLYISPTWIYDNAKLIDDESPRGTGERDYALLYISESTDKTPLPTDFPYIGVNTNLVAKSAIGVEVVSGGYPAEKLMKNGADAELTPVIAHANIGTLYTFGSNYADIFSISDSPVGEHGASGGPVANQFDKSVFGLIVTKGDVATEGEKSLRALTLSYINRTIIEETGFSLAQNMQGDVALRGNVFKNAIGPFLTNLLEEELVSARE
jgi:hypothetical protein